MQTTTSTGGGGVVPAAGSRGRRRTGRLVVGMALGAGALLGSAGPAAAVDCSPAMVFLRLCGATVTPLPTTTTTTAPPLVSLPPATLPPVTLPPAVTPPPAAMTAVEAARHLFDLVNGERLKAGLGALTPRDDLTAIAVAHSERMAQAGDIFHSDSFMSAGVKTLLGAGVRGENVAYNGDVDNAHVRLMESAGHRANILDRRFSVAGIGVARHPDGRWFITENFIQPAGAPRSAAPVASRSAPPARPAAPATTAPPVPPTPAAPTTVPAPVPAAEPLVTAPAPAAPATAPAVALEADHAASVAGPLTGAATVLLGLILSAGWLLTRRLRIG
ncbi:MAG: CAP domain-containing protein [Actinomycetota bacterium]